jgi:hypothetical protein
MIRPGKKAAAFGNGYTGFHSYEYSPLAFRCKGAQDGCSRAPGAHKNNYYTCSSCQAEASVKSMVVTLRGDDAQRHEAQLRLALNEPLPVHREVKKLHKTFVRKGGVIRIVPKPAIVKGVCGKRVAAITAPRCGKQPPARPPCLTPPKQAQ